MNHKETWDQIIKKKKPAEIFAKNASNIYT